MNLLPDEVDLMRNQWIAVRARLKVPQETAALKVGVSERSISEFESGAKPDPNALTEYCRVLDVWLEELGEPSLQNQRVDGIERYVQFDAYARTDIPPSAPPARLVVDLLRKAREQNRPDLFQEAFDLLDLIIRIPDEVQLAWYNLDRLHHRVTGEFKKSIAPPDPSSPNYDMFINNLAQDIKAAALRYDVFQIRKIRLDHPDAANDAVELLKKEGFRPVILDDPSAEPAQKIAPSPGPAKKENKKKQD